MSQTWNSVRTLIRGITVPLVISAVVAAGLVMDQGLALAAGMAGAGVVLLVVRSFAPHEDPLRDVGEVVLRAGEAEQEWLANLRLRKRAAAERRLRLWRKNMWGFWLVVAALILMLGRVVVQALWRL